MNVVVTGGTDGIGLSLVKKLLNLNHKVFMIGKDTIKAEKILRSLNNKNLEFFNCDLSEKHQIKKLIDTLNKIKILDVLVNNAGALFEKKTINSQGVEKTFALNHLSYLQLSLGLIENLEKSEIARIINVSSDAHKFYELDIDDLESKLTYNGWKAYCRSKLLNIYMTHSFKKELNTKINCNCLHPGFVNSNFGNNNISIKRNLIKILKNLFAISNDKASLFLLHLATSKELEGISGKYFNKFKETKSSSASYDTKLAKYVWDKSIDYLK